MLLSLTAKTGRIIMHMEVLHGILSSVSLTILCTEVVKEWSGLSMAFYFPILRVAIGTFISVSTRKIMQLIKIQKQLILSVSSINLQIGEKPGIDQATCFRPTWFVMIQSKFRHQM